MVNYRAHLRWRSTESHASASSSSQSAIRPGRTIAPDHHDGRRLAQNFIFVREAGGILQMRKKALESRFGAGAGVMAADEPFDQPHRDDAHDHRHDGEEEDFAWTSPGETHQHSE